MTSVLYLGCPAPERADTEKQLGAVDVSVVWGENATFALTELQRRHIPVLLDLSPGAAALQIAREIRTQRASTLIFAVVDPRRPDLTAEAVLAGMADVFVGGGTLKQARSRFEKEYITSILEQHRGRISEAARTLGIQRTNLYRKMRSLKVNRHSRG